MKPKRGLVYLWTGRGAGKTTSALGIALRAVGHGKKVVVIQFLKWWKKTGEYKIKKRLDPDYEIYQFGRKGWHGFKNLTEEDKELAIKGLKFAKKKLEEKPFLIILDEINLAVAKKLITEKQLIDFLDSVPSETTVYLTGRYAPKSIIERADFATEIKEIKHPAGNGIPARKGIEY